MLGASSERETQMDHKQAREMLRSVGLTHPQIDRLIKLRQKLSKGETGQPLVEHRRLEFARWLFTTGKLTDYCS